MQQKCISHQISFYSILINHSSLLPPIRRKKGSAVQCSPFYKKLRCFTKLSTEYALNEYKRPHYLVVKLDPHSSIFFDERDKKCVIFLKYCLRKVKVFILPWKSRAPSWRLESTPADVERCTPLCTAQCTSLFLREIFKN